MKCGRGHELHLTHLPCARKHRCTVCHEVIPRSARRFMCRRCSYDVCFDCGMHDNCLIDRSKDSQKTLRSVFKEYAMGHQRSVAISTTYDIISPSDGHMRRHQHKRGLGVGEDCRYAVFSDATMNVDTFHLPTPSERPSSRETPSSSDPTIDLARAVVKRCMQLVDVVAAEVAAGFDCLDHEWLPKRPKSSVQKTKSGYLTKHPRRGMVLSQAQRRFFVLSQGLLQWHKDDSKNSEVLGALRIGSTTSVENDEELRIQTGDSHLILTSPEGDVLKEWAEALRKEAQDPPAEELFFAVHPCLSRSKDLNSSTCLDAEPSLLAWLLEGEDAPRGYSAATVGMYAEKIDTLIRAATELQKLQPIVSEVTAPVKVFGDIHGQLRDLLLLFHFYGRPDDDEEEGDDEPMSYVFNGDWVDRGRHQLEVMLLILSLKIVHPKQVWLNRGNHEDRQQNLRTTKIGSLGFDRACFEALGAEEGRRIFESFQSFFEWLPLAARIEQKVLVLHGGLGPGDWTLEDLSQVERPLVSKELHFTLEGVVYNILWSDPLTHKPENRRDPLKSFGVHDSPRDKHWQVMKNFGRDVTQRFCKAEGLELVIRSHQFTNTCKGYELMHDGYLLRVFSARNYMGTVPNDGGMLLIGYGEDSRGSVSLVVRPRSVERLTGANRGRQNTELPGSILSYEPYCPRKHLMQLIKPEQVRCFGWTHRDSDDFRSCSECGQDDIQVECYFACRGCGDYDICIDCAGRLSRGLQALPAFSPPSRSVDSPSGFSDDSDVKEASLEPDDLSQSQPKDEVEVQRDLPI
ncbi:Serine/threonine-protein phosphatase BSU1 (Bri1 suppressor protein 1) [Durusdinium trenchii]|uniref:Serine/threonine-protein phosphatase n=1 Tax=Durusdinium trenchii TaxID=1381693 RepID=A0ABP0LT02_9DINO